MGNGDEQDSGQSEEMEDDGQIYVPRDKVDFDPDDGLLSGTAIDGTSEIPGPHEEGDDGSDNDNDNHQESAED